MKWSTVSKCLVVLAAAGYIFGTSCSARKDASTQSETGPSSGDASRAQTSWDFDSQKVGSVPPGWKVTETGGKGKPVKWQVVADTTAPSAAQVLALTETLNTGNTMNLLMAVNLKLKDLDLEVRVKVISGKHNQGSGVIWRAVDANNYYLARWTGLSNNFRVYCIKDGNPKRLATVDIAADPKAWHTIKITHQGERIVASLDGVKFMEVNDATFGEAGMIGLCTKADATAAFDDLKAQAIPPQSPRPEKEQE